MHKVIHLVNKETGDEKRYPFTETSVARMKELVKQGYEWVNVNEE